MQDTMFTLRAGFIFLFLFSNLLTCDHRKYRGAVPDNISKHYVDEVMPK
jgi:hypothetical protein